MAVHNYDIFLVVSALVFVGIAFLQYVSLLLNVYLADMGTYRVLNLLHVSNTVRLAVHNCIISFSYFYTKHYFSPPFSLHFPSLLPPLSRTR